MIGRYLVFGSVRMFRRLFILLRSFFLSGHGEEETDCEWSSVIG